MLASYRQQWEQTDTPAFLQKPGTVRRTALVLLFYNILIRYFVPFWMKYDAEHKISMRHYKLKLFLLSANYVSHRPRYSSTAVCTHLTTVACSSLSQSMWLREPQILCQTYSVCKFLHDYICIVRSGQRVGRPSKFTFKLDPGMSETGPALSYIVWAAVSVVK